MNRLSTDYSKNFRDVRKFLLSEVTSYQTLHFILAGSYAMAGPTRCAEIEKKYTHNVG